MLPRYHILYGFIFTIAFWAFYSSTHYFYLSLIFLSSFLIDFDHYVNAVLKTKSFNLSKHFNYYSEVIKKQSINHKNGLKNKEQDFQFFHTIESHLLVLILGLFFTPFLYVLIGMIFHSLLDVYSLTKENKLYIREYFFFAWLKRFLFSK